MTQIEKIEAILEYMEAGVKPDHLYLSEIFRQIDELPADKYLAHYKSYLEFTIPLLQRTTVRDTGDKPKITY
jgi:hypothetical protein